MATGVIVLAVVLAGCGATATGCPQKASVGIDTVDDPPPNAPVTDSTQLQNVTVEGTSLRARGGGTTLHEMLTRVVETRSPDGTVVEGQRVCRVQDTFADVPRHAGDRGGYYLRHDGVVVRVTLIYAT